MSHLVTRLRQSSLRRLLPPAHRSFSSAASLSTATFPETQTQKLERIADELLDLNKLERLDYSILFRLRLGLNRWGSAGADVIPSAGGSPSPADAAAAAVEKTAFDVKLEKFDSSVKLKVIKEVRAFTGLGLKEAKDLVEKTPVVVKKAVSKEDAEMITAKLKEIGATVVLE